MSLSSEEENSIPSTPRDNQVDNEDIVSHNSRSDDDHSSSGGK